MSDIAIQIFGLGKRYRYGGAAPLSTNLRADISDWAKGLFRRNSKGHPTLQQVHEHHLSASPEYFWALKDVSFEVNQGEVIGIIGRNGAGKSTLLKILSRITPPTTGHIEYHGRIASLLEVGTGFHRELTGRENIFLNGSILGMKRAEIARKFDEIVAFAEVEKFIDTPVKFYSSGMYVRLAFAVAAHLEPEILLVDEVLAVGDIEFQRKCIGKMEDVAREGRTVLVVSHSMSTVKALCSKAVLLESGRIKASGAVDGVVAGYVSASKVGAAKTVLTDADHDSGTTNQVRVRSLQLLNAPGNSFTVHWQQPISMVADVEVFEPLRDLVFGASIKTIYDTDILTIHSDIVDSKPQSSWTLEPGRYEIAFKLRNDLRPGSYRLRLGAACLQHLGRSNVLNVNAGTLQVLDFSEQGLTPRPSCTGLVNGYSTWSYERCPHQPKQTS
ncbi:MAG: ABC transporter ATP-binding protein [Verrucomicrobia bacterium]|nr:ABC transporter ATP-binding protein [Verrucomicrobiota bacterium]